METMENPLEKFVAMIRCFSTGIPMKKLATYYQQTYHENLSVSSFGYSSMGDLIASLDNDLVIEGQLVFHKDYKKGLCKASDGAGSQGSASVNATVDKEKVLANIVTMLKNHPKGILVKKLEKVYHQKYDEHLDLAALGFDSVASLLASFEEDVIVNGKRVFYNAHKPINKPIKPGKDSRPSTPQRAESPAVRNKTGFLEVNSSHFSTAAPQAVELCPLFTSTAGLPANPVTFGSNPAEKPDHQVQQQQQDQRSLEAVEKYKVTNPSMASRTTTATPSPTREAQTESQHQQATMPASLLSHDFPLLGTSVKEQKGKARDKPQRESTVPVFRDAYNSQLREVHGDNMRAVEAMEDDEELKGRRRNKPLDYNTVNSLVEDVIRHIAAEGELVTKDKVISRVCRLMQIPSSEAAWIKSWNIQAIKDLHYTVREINMFIESTEAVMSICTLYELGQSLAGLKNKKRYEELNLGPLCKLPVVHRMFKIDSNTKDDDIPQIETTDILKQLNIFRRRNPKVKVDLPDFLKHLADHYNCESPYELGIRIYSFGLPISTLIKVSRSEHLILERARETIEKELEEESHEQLRKMKKKVLETVQGTGASSFGEGLDLRKRFASMLAVDVVKEVFENSFELLNPKMAKHIQNFLLQLSGDRLARDLFQLAICGGSLAVPQDLLPKEKTPNTEPKIEKKGKCAVSVTSEAKVKQYLKESLANHSSAVTLAFIASLERKLTKHFQVEDFLSLGQGNFLEFLVKHIQLLQDTLGFTLTLGGGSSNMELTGNGLRPTRQDVFEFIKQCVDKTSADPDDISHIEMALRSHFKIRDVRDLGFGPLQMLAKLVQRQRGLAGGGLSQVYYESALFSKHAVLSTESGCEKVGCEGGMLKAQALASLLSCPLLEDLKEWSQWELVFKPEHHSLKDFIETNAGNTGLAALEVTPGLLLRISRNTGDKEFSNAVMDLDPVGTAGHLVSMVVIDGITGAPIALLANHMQASLAAAVAKEDLFKAEDMADMPRYNRVATFLLECLARIPMKTCQALLQQVFLEPLSLVLGQSVSKQVLISAAQSNPKHLNCLHRLGILQGIMEWVKDYHQKLNPPEQQNHRMGKVHVLQAQSNNVDIESLSEDEYLDENMNDNSSLSSHPSQSPKEVSGEQEEAEEEEDKNELLELLPQENEAMSNNGNKDKDSDKEAQSELSDFNEDETADCQPETPLDPCRAVIEDIRKKEFGIGVELNAEGQKLMLVQQERLGRSLDRLSTELYSKDTHFVLELIQNADDNSYSTESGLAPALAFVVAKDCITVLNNETGFQEKNIRAICDVGCSTKGKHKSGYIGQKGIGFKSVFKVTDCPEIHSNGFHLYFDKNCGPMGYILPHWTEDTRPLEPELSDQNRWTTKICLPLRPESHQTRNLFHDVHPSLLLFLHRLRSITIYNQNEKRLVTMTRKDLSHNMVEVEHTDGVERWLVVKTSLKPKIATQIKENVESTELALAFQLGTDITGSKTVCQPQKQPVFAYLPLRSFGFRFIIQGDFDIPSSREDVDKDSLWNQWLRSEIPKLFLQTKEVFCNHPEFSGLNGLCQFLQFIPLPDEVLDFFKPVAGQIIQLLKGEPILPTLNSDGEVVFKLPSQVAVCQDAVIRNVIGGEELEKHLSLSYLHPGLNPAPPTSLLSHLGVRYLRGFDVTTVTTAMAKELMKGEGICTDRGLLQLARLLVCNFRALEYGYGEGDDILQTLRNLPIIPLADGRLVALNGEGVFFPVVATDTKKTQAQTDPLDVLYKDVNVVTPALLSCMEPLENEQVRKLLKRLGVHELEPKELLEQHIYPALQNNKWKSKSEDVVVSYLVFIKKYSASNQEYADIAVPVLTSRGMLFPGLDRVHFSVEYGNINLKEELPGCDWVLLSHRYVQTDSDVAGWRELFGRLGVRDGLIIRKERRTLTSEELATSPWSKESAMWQQNPRKDWTLDDYPCEEFYTLATAQLSEPVLLKQRHALLLLLGSNWDTGHCYSQYLTAQVIDGNGHPIKSAKSSFYHFLCRLEWIPAYRPLEGQRQEIKYHIPSSVYLTSPEITSLLGSHVFYLDREPSEFTRALGMRQSISAEALMNYLKEWCVKSPADNQDQMKPREESEGAYFSTTVQHIHSVYSYLYTKCSPVNVKELFKQIPAVFVQQEYSKNNTGWCSGHFYHLKEVCWSDTTKMFQRYRALTKNPDSPIQEPNVLAPFYSKLEYMKEFFYLLDVELSPNMKQYVGLLELICLSSNIPTAEVLQDVSVLYARLAQKCKNPVPTDHDDLHRPKLNSRYCSTLKGMMCDKRVFPTKDNNWVSLARKPMIADNKELEKVFKPHKQVCLLNLPAAEKITKSQDDTAGRTPISKFNEQDRSLFMEICGIRPLSKCVKTEPVTENLRPCPSMQAMVRSVIPYVQKFLYHNNKLYSEIAEDNIGEKIKRLNFAQVGKLYKRYQLSVADNEDDLTEMEDVICLLKDKKELYIQKDHLSAKLDICRELVKLFFTESVHKIELMNFLSGLITSLDDPAALKRFLNKEDIRELPEEEEPWEVPEPFQPEVILERGPLSSYSSYRPSAEASRPTPEDGQQTLVCWPPRASVQNTGVNRTGQAFEEAVEAVMKMWPPPAPPVDRDPEREAPHRGSGHVTPQDQNNSSRPADRPGPHRAPRHPDQPEAPLANNDLPAPVRSQQTGTAKAEGARRGEEILPEPGATQAAPSAQPIESASKQPAADSLPVPDVVVRHGTFQGAAESQRPPLNLDFPQWSRVQSPHTTLEDMKLTCQRPDTVVLSDDHGDVAAIGDWGEQLVNSFLCDWRDSGDPGRPSHILWCNQAGESGQPYDFKLTFGGEGQAEVFVEVKSTIKKEKSFIHLSANELDFALKEKERYHIYRVYSAGDADHVRLCRIQNLAQHLHTKDLVLYLFV